MKTVMKTAALGCVVLSISACASTGTTTPAPYAYETPALGAADYMVTFRNFSDADRLAILDAMATVFPGNGTVGNHEGSRAASTVNYRSALKTAGLERELYALLASMGYSENEVRLTTRDNRYLTVERIIFGRGR